MEVRRFSSTLWFLATLIISPAILMSASPSNSKFFLYVGIYGKGIQAFRYDPQTAAFDPLGQLAVFHNPSFLTADGDGRFLYAVSEVEGNANGAVGAFQIEPATGKLAALNQASSEGVAPCHLAVDRSKKLLMAANYGTGSVPVFSLGADGRLGKLEELLTASGHGPDPKRQEGPHAHETVLSADGRFLYVPDLGLDQICIYKIDASSGAVTPNNPPFSKVPAGMGPRHIVFSRDGNFAYVMSELKSVVLAFKVNGANGSLEQMQAIAATADGKDFDGAAEILLHPNGKFLYASVRGPGTIAVFSVDGQSGHLKKIQDIKTGGTWPRGVEFDPTGTLLLAGDQKSNEVALFKVDGVSGRLTLNPEKLHVQAPVAFAFVPAQ